jgi:hypothetical protein
VSTTATLFAGLRHLILGESEAASRRSKEADHAKEAAGISTMAFTSVKLAPGVTASFRVECVLADTLHGQCLCVR